MIALTTPYLWYTTRATGMVTLILFTMVVSLGTLVANRIGGTIVGRFEINELHRSLTMVAMTFLAIHILTTVLDSFVPTGLISVVIPMTSQYKRVAVGVGAISFDLILAVWTSSLLKLRIPNTTWRFIHWFSWLGFSTALVHGFMTGTDSRKGIGLIVVVACALTVLIAALWRFFGRPTRAAGRTALSPLAGTTGPQVTSGAPRPAPPSRPATRSARPLEQTRPAPARAASRVPGSPRTPGVEQRSFPTSPLPKSKKRRP
ncbi:MAG: hypothetical protein ACYC1I_00295 [Acidimicrobiales bacterium]